MRVGNYAEQMLKDVIALGDFRLPEDVLNSIDSFGKNAIHVYERSLNAFFESNVSDSFEIMRPVQTEINIQTLNLNRKLAENQGERIPCEKMCHVIQIVANMKRVADQGVELAETNIYHVKQAN
jgi:phosphate uptake regulator